MGEESRREADYEVQDDFSGEDDIVEVTEADTLLCKHSNFSPLLVFDLLERQTKQAWHSFVFFCFFHSLAANSTVFFVLSPPCPTKN